MFFWSWCERCKKESMVTAYNYKFLCSDCRRKEYIEAEREFWQQVLFYDGDDKKLKKYKNKTWDDIYLSSHIDRLKADLIKLFESVPRGVFSIIARISNWIDYKIRR